MSAVLFDTNALIAICRENDVAKLEVFGSTARGEADDNSDVDLLVEFSKRKSLLALVSLGTEDVSRDWPESGLAH